MNLATIDLPNVMTIVVIVTLAFAVREDLLQHRIPNVLNLAGLTSGLGIAFLLGGVGDVVTSMAGALVGCAAFAPLYLLRGMSAGDIKLMGATGAFLGPSGALTAAALALIAGAVLGIAVALWRLVEPRPLLENWPLREGSGALRAAATISIVRKERFPYAIAIAVGVIATLWLRGSLGALFGVMETG